MHADHQGSIIALSNSTGASVTNNAYDAFGIAGANNQGRFGYTGQLLFKELGLNHYKARFYSPILGRFLQTDPIGYKDQMNLYAYVGNDPVNKTDPTGLYGRGDGFSDDQWKKFNKVQQAAANAMEKRAGKLDAKADKLDAKGKGGGDDLRKAASNLRGGAADLRSTTKVANMVDGKTMDTINGGQCAGGAACASIGGNSIWVNKDSNTWNSGNNQRMGWLLGHESMHSGAGLNDKASNGYFSYIVGDDNQRSTFYGLQGTSEGYEKPDNLMYLVYPGAWPKL